VRTTTSHKRVLAVLKPPKRVPAFITYGSNIVARMTGNPSFPKPSPSLAKVKAAIAALQKAEAAVLSGKRGLAIPRNDARAVALRLLQELTAYVQKIADANPEEALAIIESAGLSAKRSSGTRAHKFEVTPTGISGSVRLTLPVAGDRAVYLVQMSIDGRKTWIDLPQNNKSTSVVPQLTPATIVFFRYRTVTPKGKSDWSDPISLMVD
jgi:hypothetical protein